MAPVRDPKQNQALQLQLAEDVEAQVSRQSDKVLSLFSSNAVIVMVQALSLETLACKLNLFVDLIYRSCRGRGTTTNTVKETINIPKGVDTGVNLRVSKKGNFSPVGPPGDLMINIKVKPHPYFKREGFDILTDLYLSVG